MVRGAERGNQVGLEPVGGPIEDVHSQAALHPEQGGQEADRSGAGDQGGGGLPAGPGADALDVVPGLGHHGGGLQKDAELVQAAIHLDQKVGRDAEALAGVTVVLFDPPFRVLAVAAHVPLADGAVRARDGIRAAHDRHHQVAGHESGVCGGLAHVAEGFVADGEARFAGRGPAVVSVDDLDVGAAYADGSGFDEYRSVGGGWLVEIGEVDGTRLERNDGDGAHGWQASHRGTTRLPVGRGPAVMAARWRPDA